MMSLLRMEKDRIDFMLKSYLRVRLQKLEQHVLYYAQATDMRSRLSSNEAVCFACFVMPATSSRHDRLNFGCVVGITG